jgi:glycosyltransferase involved in cell wall biosynthesis
MYWDLSCLPVGDAITINRCADAVFVSSQFTRSNLLSGGVQVPIHVWPHGVEAPEGSQGGVRPRADGVFRFLFVGVAQERKGIEELLVAWKRAFAGRDDVRLTIKSADWGKVDKYRAECDDDRIEWLHRNIPRGDLRDLYARSDCLVLPSRAESFGLPILEAMVVGLPVIVSAYGGHLDYCSNDTAYLVPGTMKPAMSTLDAVMNGYEELPQWSVCDVDLLVDTLRRVVSKPAEVERRAQRARSVAATMTWEAGAERAVPILRALQRATAADRWW